MQKYLKVLLTILVFSGFIALINYYKPFITPLLHISNKENQIDTNKQKQTVFFTYEERMERGDYYSKNAFLSLAINEYTKANQIHPELAEPYFKLGQNHFFLGNYDKTKINLEKALEIEQDNQTILVYLIKNYLKQSSFEKVKSIITQADQNNNEILYYSALIDLLENNYVLAQDKFHQITKTSDNEKLKEKTANILNSFEEFSLFKGGKDIHLNTLVAKSLNQVEEFEIALTILKNILKEKVDYRDAWILTGYAYLNLEKYDFALDSFRKAYDLDSEKPETQYFLGITYFELNKIEDALTYLNIALKNGFEPQIQIKQKLGDIYLNKKDYDKAVEMYEDVLKLNNQDIGMFIRPIWIYLDFLQDPDKALELSQKAYKLFPENAMTYNLLAWSHIGKKEYLKAEEYLKKAIKLNPNLQAAWYNLGRVYEGLNQREKALEHYQKTYETGKDTSIGNIAAQAYNKLYNE